MNSRNYKKYKNIYYKKTDPRQFEYGPSAEYELPDITLLSLQRSNARQFLELKSKFKEKSADYYTEDELDKITSALLGHNDEWGVGIYNMFLFAMGEDLMALKTGFNLIKSDLKKEYPPIYNDKKIKSLFIALEDYGFFPSANYIDENSKINKCDWSMIQNAFETLRKNNLLNGKFPKKNNTVLFNDLYQLHLDIFQTVPDVTIDTYNENYTGKSKVFFESVFHVLGEKDISLKKNERKLDQDGNEIIPIMESLVNNLKDRKKT